MARKRQIDPCIWTSEQFNLIEPTARLLYIGMISNADDEGRLKASPQYLKTIILPADSYTISNVLEWRSQIVSVGLVILYEHNGVEFISLPTWDKYQYISKPYPSKIPPPHSNTITQPLPNHSLTDKGTVSESINKDGLNINQDYPTLSENERSFMPVREHSDTIPALQHRDEDENGIGIENGNGIEDEDAPTNSSSTNKNKLNIFDLYSQEIGELTAIVSEKLKDAELEYTEAWVYDAISQASLRNKKSLTYILKTLENCKIEGHPPSKSNGKHPKKGERKDYTGGRYGHVVQS